MALFLAEFGSTHRTAGNLRILQPTPRSLGGSQVVLYGESGIAAMLVFSHARK
jgi:hypothetical protein